MRSQKLAFQPPTHLAPIESSAISAEAQPHHATRAPGGRVVLRAKRRRPTSRAHWQPLQRTLTNLPRRNADPHILRRRSRRSKERGGPVYRLDSRSVAQLERMGIDMERREVE
jgi:hypothetical protein